jgi:hypothetical protein
MPCFYLVYGKTHKRMEDSEDKKTWRFESSESDTEGQVATKPPATAEPKPKRQRSAAQIASFERARQKRLENIRTKKEKQAAPAPAPAPASAPASAPEVRQIHRRCD